MPALYDHLGVRFQYPDNWILEGEPAGRDHTSVTVVSPQGAFWSLTIHPASEDLAGLLRVVLDALRAEYQELDAERAVQAIGGRQLVGYDVNFYCLDLTNTAQVRGFQTDRATYVLLCQAEDRDFTAVERVFLAMTTSLMAGMASNQED